MQVFLETERLALRRFTAADADNLFELDGDPEVMRFISGGAPTPRELIETVILPRFLRSHERCPGFGYWAAVEKSSGQFLGWFGLMPREGGSPAEADLGYRLRRSAWGKGYATEGARALIHKGFTELGVERVLATTYEHNLASRRVMEKVGMTLVRTFHMTPEELAAQTTFHSGWQLVWEGDDVEYALQKSPLTPGPKPGSQRHPEGSRGLRPTRGRGTGLQGEAGEGSMGTGSFGNSPSPSVGEGAGG